MRSYPEDVVIVKKFNLLFAFSSSYLIFQTFLPLLRKAAAQKSSDEYSVDRAAILNISSGVGSISTNTSGSGQFGSLAYRMSKVSCTSSLFGLW